jgi:tetratricopeptide (TPR) repeat protein
MFRQLGVIYLLVMFLINCGSKYPEGALIISSKDTLYNADILSASDKINKEPFNAEYYYLRANAFFYQKDYPHAIQDLSCAISLNARNPLYHLRIAQSYIDQDSANYLKASKHLKTSLELKPDYSEAQFILAKLLLARQQYSQAESMFLKLKDDSEYASKSKLLLVVAYKEQKDTLKALTVLDDILLNDPNNYDATMQKALFLLNKNEELASQFVDKALSIDEFNSEALYLKGLILQRKGKYADAEIIYNRAIKIDPSHIFAHYNLAVIQSMFDNNEAVIDLCGKILDLDPNNYKALVLRGYAFEQKGNKKAALFDYKAAIQINPDYKPAQEYLKSLN